MARFLPVLDNLANLQRCIRTLTDRAVRLDSEVLRVHMTPQINVEDTHVSMLGTHREKDGTLTELRLRVFFSDPLTVQLAAVSGDQVLYHRPVRSKLAAIADNYPITWED